MKIYCVIPAYNEKGNLVSLANLLTKTLEKICKDYKVLFVIQGEDGSLNAVKKLKNRHIDFLYFKRPLGIGKAYKTGFSTLSNYYTHVLTLDADLNHDPRMLKMFIDKMNATGSDIVIGSRFIKGGKFLDKRIWKRIVSKLTNKIVIYFSGIKIHDISSGFRLIKSGVVKQILTDLKENGYPNYMEFIIKANRRGFKISEVPIVYKPRVWGKSKILSVSTFIEYIFFLKNQILFTKYPN